MDVNLPLFEDGKRLFASQLNPICDAIRSVSPATVGAYSKGEVDAKFNALSGSITATAPYPGAAQRNVSAKLADFVSVKDFGATGDGVTDDTAAVQAAINAVKGRGNVGLAPASLYFPNGDYSVTGLLIDRSISMWGGDRRNARLILRSPASVPLITIAVQHDGSNYANLGHPGPLVHLRNLRLQGSGKGDTTGAANGADIVRFQNALANSIRPGVLFESCLLYNGARDGLNAFSWIGAATMIGCSVYNLAGTGLNANSCNDWQFYGTAFGVCGSNGISLSGCGQFQFFGTNTYSHVGHDLYIFDNAVGGQNHFFGCSFDRAGKAGVFFDARGPATSRHYVFTNCYFQANSSGSGQDGLWADMHIGGSTLDDAGPRLVNCWFEKAKPADATNHTSYNIQFNGANGTADAYGCTFEAGDLKANPAGVSNRPADIKFRAGSLTAAYNGAAIDSALTVRTAAQYTGLGLSNGTNGIFSVKGFASDNDTGVLTLSDGGTPRVQLSSNASAVPSYFDGDLHVGKPSAAPVSRALRGADGAGTDIAGGNLSLTAGRGTGAAAGGYVEMRTSPAGTTGTAVNGSLARLTASGNGVTFNNVLASARTPAANGDLTFESNAAGTALVLRLKGPDGVVRSATIALA